MPTINLIHQGSSSPSDSDSKISTNSFLNICYQILSIPAINYRDRFSTKITTTANKATQIRRAQDF